MSTVAEVRLWGNRIGAVALEAGSEVAAFEYDPDFLNSGIEVAPLQLPLASRIYSFPTLAGPTFHGLPGLLADSLPDKFGNALIDAWLVGQGRTAASFNAVERLCYTGTRGMGALEFAPVKGPRTTKTSQIRVDQLVELASDILTKRGQLQSSLRDGERSAALKQILQVGTSAGGARAKAVIAWNPVTEEVNSGQIQADPGFEYWLIKFDGVKGNRDQGPDDPDGMGAIEYAYSQMAKACGIQMSDCRLLEENGRRHFMTRRFDRHPEGGKIHMLSMAAMAHLDFNPPGAHSYEQVFQTLKELALPQKSVEQQFRRMTFNILARNQDDHVKNIAFLMNQEGQWSLAPAFDLTYAYDPAGRFTSLHQLNMNGKRDGFTPDDFRACGRSSGLKQGRALQILHEVASVVTKWPAFADEAGVDSSQRDQIQRALRSDMLKE